MYRRGISFPQRFLWRLQTGKGPTGSWFPGGIARGVTKGTDSGLNQVAPTGCCLKISLRKGSEGRDSNGREKRATSLWPIQVTLGTVEKRKRQKAKVNITNSLCKRRQWNSEQSCNNNQHTYMHTQGRVLAGRLKGWYLGGLRRFKLEEQRSTWRRKRISPFSYTPVP